jgi:hypothetical protein
MTHKIVFHNRIHLYHLVPAAAILLAQHQDVREWTEDLVDRTLEGLDNFRKNFN